MAQDNIFREVDEELRSDRMRALWRRFAPFVIGAAIAVVAVVAVNEGWTWYHNNNAAQSSDELYAALELADGGDLAAAQAQLEALMADGSGRYPTLAQFAQAGLLARQGNTAEAVAAYDGLANSLSNPYLRELALVQAGMLLVDAGSVGDVEARLATVAAEGNPLRNAAREALGLAYYQAGDYAAAQAQFDAVLNDPLSQSSQRNRMGYYMAQLLAEGVVEPEAVAETSGLTEETVVEAEPAAEIAAEPAPPESVMPPVEAQSDAGPLVPVATPETAPAQ